jgi:hypothetical protein
MQTGNCNRIDSQSGQIAVGLPVDDADMTRDTKQTQLKNGNPIRNF